MSVCVSVCVSVCRLVCLCVYGVCAVRVIAAVCSQADCGCDRATGVSISDQENQDNQGRGALAQASPTQGADGGVWEVRGERVPGCWEGGCL